MQHFTYRLKEIDTDELLELTLEQFNACVLGASDVQKDQLAMYMQLAYYTAYWNNAKHPRKLERVIKDIYKDQNSKKEKSDFINVVKIYSFFECHAMNTYFDLYIIMCVIFLWFVLSY